MQTFKTLDPHMVWVIGIVIGGIATIATVWLTIAVFHRRRNFDQGPKSDEIAERPQLLRNGPPDKPRRAPR